MRGSAREHASRCFGTGEANSREREPREAIARKRLPYEPTRQSGGKHEENIQRLPLSALERVAPVKPPVGTAARAAYLQEGATGDGGRVEFSGARCSKRLEHFEQGQRRSNTFLQEPLATWEAQSDLWGGGGIDNSGFNLYYD